MAMAMARIVAVRCGSPMVGAAPGSCLGAYPSRSIGRNREACAVRHRSAEEAPDRIRARKPRGGVADDERLQGYCCPHADAGHCGLWAKGPVAGSALGREDLRPGALPAPPCRLAPCSRGPPAPRRTAGPGCPRPGGEDRHCGGLPGVPGGLPRRPVRRREPRPHPGAGIRGRLRGGQGRAVPGRLAALHRELSRVPPGRPCQRRRSGP